MSNQISILFSHLSIYLPTYLPISSIEIFSPSIYLICFFISLAVYFEAKDIFSFFTKPNIYLFIYLFLRNFSKID